MNKPDILIFLSDQHNPIYTEIEGNERVITPNISRIANEGTVFEAAYTSCPLCVPSRMSMLTGQLPSTTGIFTNRGSINEGQATFLHSLVLEGYETVLCGRMHFIGANQRHGFTKRIMGDFTALHLGVNSNRKKELGVFDGTTGERKCHKVVGGGTSPVLEYDKVVINKALSYLKEEHKKPQCIVVGTYGPHSPYVAPPELYKYYGNIADIPVTLKENTNSTHPALKYKEQILDENKIKKIRAAYLGMITNIDMQVGEIHNAWKRYLNERNRKGIFVYLSDHGDQVGERNLYGKQTFYDSSARIPLIFEGDGIEQDHKIRGGVSIMDLGPTLCDFVGAVSLPLQEGQSLLKQLTSKDYDEEERPVISEFVLNMKDKYVPGRMVRQGEWKLISYYLFEEEDMLFNIAEDPYELNNLAPKYPHKIKELREKLEEGWYPEEIIKEYAYREKNYDLLTKWGNIAGGDEKERWTIPETAAKPPQII